MCFTLIWHIESCSFIANRYYGDHFRPYSPWFIVRNTHLRLAIFPDGWRIFRSEHTQEYDIEYETSLNPDSNTPQATAILPKDSICSGPLGEFGFPDMISEQDIITLRLRVRSSEPGFCRFRTSLRLVSRFEIKITTFSNKIIVGNGQVNTFLVYKSFLPTSNQPTCFLHPYQPTRKNDPHDYQKQVEIHCSNFGQVYFRLSDGSPLNSNTYITVSLIDSRGNKIVSQTLDTSTGFKFSTCPSLSAIGNNLLIEWRERVDETVEFGQNCPYTHFPLHRNGFDFPNRMSSTVKKPSMFTDPDFVLQAQSKSFPVHSQALLQHSEFFRGLLGADMKEKQEGRVVLDTDAETVERIVKFLYEGVVESTLEAEQVFSLYLAASQYLISELQKDCSSLLASRLDPSSVCGILALAEAHRDQRLKIKAQNYICANRDDVLNSSEWRLFKESHRALASEVKNIVEACSGKRW